MADSDSLNRILAVAEREDRDIIDVPVKIVGNNKYRNKIKSAFNNKSSSRKLDSSLLIIKNTYLTGGGPTFHLWQRIYRTSIVKQAESHFEKEHIVCADDIYAFFLICYFARTWSRVDIAPIYCYRVGSGISTGDLSLKTYCARTRAGEIFRMLRSFLDQQKAPEIYYECVRATERSVAQRSACELLDLAEEYQETALVEFKKHFPAEIIEPALWMAIKRAKFKSLFRLLEALLPENTIRRRMALRIYHGTAEKLGRMLTI